MTAPRVVSLVPSATESLVALGADVVACTRFCKQPAIRAVGGTKNPDVDAIVALRPDLVVVDTEENRREDAEALAARGVRVLATEVRSVATAADAVAALATAAAAVPPPAAARLEDLPPGVTAFAPIWRRPWMTISGDTYGASLLRSLGVELVTATAADRYFQVDLDEMAARLPDLVLVPSEPYAFDDGHVAELSVAFPAAAVVPIDGEDLFWWGIRTPAAHARLGRVLAPVLGAEPSVSRGPTPR